MALKTVPVLITWDVDPDRWTTLERRHDALCRALDVCEESSIRSTFFFTASFAHEYPDKIARMKAQGHEIGCHGLTHTDEEDYNRMTAEMQQDYIRQATQKLEQLAGAPVRSFRSPRVKTSATTLELLGKNGYQVDSSVCSQRIDFLSSNLINPGWIIAPRGAYHPGRKSAFKRGELPIWEIPVSALVLPYISGSLNVFGLKLMKIFFRLLYWEARRTGRPVVYLSHPTDLLPVTKKPAPTVKLKQFSLSSIRTHGFLFRRVFYRMSGDACFQATRQLFAYMASFPDVEFTTCTQFIDSRLS